AGEFEDVTLACGADSINLEDLENLDSEASSGGTFTGDGVVDNQFTPIDGQSEYTITYSVDDSAFCVTEGTSDSTEFTITVGNEVEEIEPIFVNLCEDTVLDNPSVQNVQTYLDNLISNNTSLSENGTFEPN